MVWFTILHCCIVNICNEYGDNPFWILFIRQNELMNFTLAGSYIKNLLTLDIYKKYHLFTKVCWLVFLYTLIALDGTAYRWYWYKWACHKTSQICSLIMKEYRQGRRNSLKATFFRKRAYTKAAYWHRYC